MPAAPIDPLTGPPFILQGRVATMDDAFTVIPEGNVYVNQGSIAAVQPAAAPPPPDPAFSGLQPIKTGGTIYPGLIELHNHLSYNALPMWEVPKKFTNRGQWSSGAMQDTYRRLISGPMTVLGRTHGLVEAVVRYVEAKCLLGGVTTSQGIALFSNNGISTFYKGLVRNVEESGEADLHDAATRIPDVESKNAAKFLARLKKSSCLLLHLAEGSDDHAHNHFAALGLSGGAWAITPALAGIHCVALTESDFGEMAKDGGTMVWSPLSNLLLYAQTADVAAAKKSGVTIALGSDWSPSGSKNLLGELKVARLFDPGKHTFSDRDLVAMATKNAARIVKWDGLLGSIEKDKRADLLVAAADGTDPYDALIHARETDIKLVVINGVPRYGTTQFMGKFDLGDQTEARTVGQTKRTLFWRQETANQVVGKLTLADAESRLQDALQRLPELAAKLEHAPLQPEALAAGADGGWFLQLDHDDPPGIALRPHLPGPDGKPTGELPQPSAAGVAPLSKVLEPISLDPPTVADDSSFLALLAKQVNLPPDIAKALPDLY